MVYNVDQEQKDYLYYAASSAVNGGDFDRALKYYQELKDMNYSGSVEKFYATKTKPVKKSSCLPRPMFFFKTKRLHEF